MSKDVATFVSNAFLDLVSVLAGVPTAAIGSIINNIIQENVKFAQDALLQEIS